MGISLKGFGNSTGQGATIAGLTALPPAASGIRLPPSNGDPYFSDVALLITGDTISDVKGNTITNNNPGGVYSTSSKQLFDLDTIYFDGVSGRSLIISNSDFNIGTDDFTIEYWINNDELDNASRTQLYCDNSSNQLTLVHRRYRTGYTGFGEFTTGFFNNGASRIGGLEGASTVMAVNTWYHVASVKSAGQFITYLDGVEISSYAITTQQMNTHNIYLGSYGTNFGPYMHKGYLSNIRYTKGVARYTEAFDVPTASFPTS